MPEPTKSETTRAERDALEARYRAHGQPRSSTRRRLSISGRFGTAQAGSATTLGTFTSLILSDDQRLRQPRPIP